MNHENNQFNADDPRITAFVFGELSEHETQEFEAMLAGSSDLRELVEQTRATVASLESKFQRESSSADDARCLDSKRREQLDKAFVGEAADQSADNNSQVALANPRRLNRRTLAVIVAVGAALCLAAIALPIVQFVQQQRLAKNEKRNIESQFSTISQLESSSQRVPEAMFEATKIDKDTASVLLAAEGKSTHSATSTVNAPTPHPTSSQAPIASAAKDEYKRWEGEKPSKQILAGGVVEPSGGWKYSKGRVAFQRDDYGYAGKNSDGGVQLMVTPRIVDFEEGDASPFGEGPGQGGDKYDLIIENEFLRAMEEPLSTFSIDVDTASYSKVRMFLNEANQLPRPDAVRIEELINYFPYDYEGPDGDAPFAAHQVVAECPWNPKHRLVRVAIKGKEIEYEKRPASNLVFLLDVSGSMDRANKLPLLKRGMKMLVDQLGENDRVAIVVYAGAAGLVLDSTTGDQKPAIVGALDRLNAGGSTNGGQGIQLAYQTALDNFIPGGTNRVVLCTDGDFNVGTTGTDQLVRIVEEQAKSNIFISVLGFGMGNHNDSMLEQISNKGNGNYAFVDTDSEAKKVLVEQLSGTLITIAKDVKIQVDFNPNRVAAYRLVGYENRIMAAQDFNDDTKDAGEIGAGHTVTAFYEIIPAGEDIAEVKSVDESKYLQRIELKPAAESKELMTLRLRYKQPEGDTSKLLQFPLKDEPLPFAKSDKEFQFAASVASFGMLLRNSKYKGNATYASVLEIAESVSENDPNGYRTEFLQLVRKAKELTGE